MATYEVRVTDMTGTSLGVLDDAVLESLSWELNESGAASFTLATTDADASLILPGREVQIRRDGTLVFWGPIVRHQGGLRTSTWQCAGLLWYFGRRFIGRADRVNYLTNGDFEAGEASWTFNAGVTHSLDTGIKVEGTQSLKLTGATANHQQYASQTSAAWVQSHPYGDALTASTWVYVPSAQYQGGAAMDIGLAVVHRDSTGELKFHDHVEIGDDTEKDAWIPLEVVVPAVLQGDTVEVRLVPPHGVAYFDLVTLTAMESLSFWPSFDVADIIEGIVLYAQDTAPYDFNHGKSDLNIGVSAAATGTMLQRVYQFSEHRNVLDAILEFVRQGVVDIDVAITATTRTFTTYQPKGSLYGTTLVLNTHIADFTWSWDGEAAASQVVVLGPGDGPDRPEGGATDAGGFNGLSLEHVESAPDHVTVGELDDRAAETLAVVSNPEIFEITTMPGVGHDIVVGDRVPINLSHGWVAINATYRVVHKTVSPKTDQVTFELNLVS